MLGCTRRCAVMVVGSLMFAALGLLSPLSARAAGLVTDCNDSGPGSLRAAIVGGGAITFQAGLNCTGPSAILLTSGTLTLAADTTIDATGHTIVVDGGCTGCEPGGAPSGGVRVLQVNSGVTARLTALTIQHGNAATYPNGGGGIDNNGGTLTVTNCTFSGNSAPSGTGGGIAVIATTVTLIDTIVAGNGGGDLAIVQSGGSRGSTT